MNDRDMVDAIERWERLRDAAPIMYATLKFVSTDPCFRQLGSVTHDEVYAAIAKAEWGRAP